MFRFSEARVVASLVTLSLYSKQPFRPPLFLKATKSSNYFLLLKTLATACESISHSAVIEWATSLALQQTRPAVTAQGTPIPLHVHIADKTLVQSQKNAGYKFSKCSLFQLLTGQSAGVWVKWFYFSDVKSQT